MQEYINVGNQRSRSRLERLVPNQYRNFYQPVSISIIDVVGKESLKTPDEYFPEGHHTVAANLGNLKEGIYFCRLQFGNEMITKKIIKVK
jgi:hypothetical protein